MASPYTIFSIGDTAITIEFGKSIQESLNEKALAIREWMLNHPFEGLKELVLSFSSLTCYYDPFIVWQANPNQSPSQFVSQQLEKAVHHLPAEARLSEPVLHQIPVVYGQPGKTDLEALAELRQTDPETLINIHLAAVYRVYMIGFLPGFCYMGELDPYLDFPRKAIPVPVAAGAVAIANRQTGIYPLNSPGGWQVIGHSPLTFFNQHSELPVWIKAGDRVQFYRA